MAQIILDSNNNLIQGDFDNATLNNRTKLQTTTTNATTNVYVVPNGSATSAGVSVANNSSLTNASKIVMATNGSTDTQIISGVNGSGSYLPMSFYTNNAQSMIIDTAGNVGIGTSSPATKLEVNGPIRVGSTDPIYFGGTTNYITGSNGSNYLQFVSNNTERMRIDASGSVLIGPSSSAPLYPYNTINAVNYKRQLTSGTAQSVFTFTKTATAASSGLRTSFVGTLYIAFSGRTSGGTTSAYGFTATVNLASTAGSTISLAASSVSSLNAVASGLTVSCAVSVTSASATSANLSVTITQTAGTLQDNEITASLIGANCSTDSTSFFTVTPA
jgi:hypothetical protein